MAPYRALPWSKLFCGICHSRHSIDGTPANRNERRRGASASEIEEAVIGSSRAETLNYDLCGDEAEGQAIAAVDVAICHAGTAPIESRLILAFAKVPDHAQSAVTSTEGCDCFVLRCKASMLAGNSASRVPHRPRLAPLVGIGCPGIINAGGSIERGAQDLPGNRESSKLNLPRAVQEAVPEIGEHETIVVMQNDAVVQGLSELPRMQDGKRWAVLTIGTGLGNASFANRAPQEKKD
jgi:hypothetical protein